MGGGWISCPTSLGIRACWQGGYAFSAWNVRAACRVPTVLGLGSAKESGQSRNVTKFSSVSSKTCRNIKKAKKQVTKEMSYSIAGLPLADIPLDCIALASIHIILGFAKKSMSGY